jgi:hypothetical protein
MPLTHIAAASREGFSTKFAHTGRPEWVTSAPTALRDRAEVVRRTRQGAADFAADGLRGHTIAVAETG